METFSRLPKTKNFNWVHNVALKIKSLPWSLIPSRNLKKNLKFLSIFQIFNNNKKDFSAENPVNLDTGI